MKLNKRLRETPEVQVKGGTGTHRKIKKPAGTLKANSHLHILALQSTAGDSCCELISQVNCLAMSSGENNTFLFLEG